MRSLLFSQLSSHFPLPILLCAKKNRGLFMAKFSTTVVLSRQNPVDWRSLWQESLNSVQMLQVSLCQKLLFLHQLTHNMTTDCSLNYNFKTWKFQAQTWGEHVLYRNCFRHAEQFLYTTCSPHVLSLEFSCIELVIQWTICRHIVG